MKTDRDTHLSSRRVLSAWMIHARGDGRLDVRHLADYLPANLEEIERSRTGDPAAHDWREFVATRSNAKGSRPRPTRSHPARGAHPLQDHATAPGRRAPPVPLEQRYATVISAYGSDSASDDRATWEPLMANITGRVGPGGLSITAALRRCRSYLVGDQRFPSAKVDEHDVRRVLVLAFSLRVQVRDLEGHAAQGYSSVVLARARRRERRSGAPREACAQGYVLITPRSL